MPTLQELATSVAAIIADYRQGEIPPPGARHVERWIGQFDEPVRHPMLAELLHVLTRTYASKSVVEDFLRRALESPTLVGPDLSAFRTSTRLLALQRAGSGQSEMLAIVRSLLGATPESDADDCAVHPRRFLYLDDVLFTGNRVKDDLIRWVERDAPPSAELVVAAIAMHVGGRNFAHVQIVEAAKAAGKTIDVKWLCAVLVEDRKAEIDRSDVLRPVSIPDDEPTRRYVHGMREAPLLRRPGHVGDRGFFSSEAGRHLLEQELLKAGCRIVSACPGLGPNSRPLGNFIRDTLGFGTLFLTYRNCPQNAPLALWAEAPWYPLLPRKWTSERG
jgi:hypothetical protein